MRIRLEGTRHESRPLCRLFRWRAIDPAQMRRPRAGHPHAGAWAGHCPSHRDPGPRRPNGRTLLPNLAKAYADGSTDIHAALVGCLPTCSAWINSMTSCCERRGGCGMPPAARALASASDQMSCRRGRCPAMSHGRQLQSRSGSASKAHFVRRFPVGDCNAAHVDATTRINHRTEKLNTFSEVGSSTLPYATYKEHRTTATGIFLVALAVLDDTRIIYRVIVMTKITTARASARIRSLIDL